MPYTTINSGDYITSAWANANVRDQVVTPYSSTSDRSTNGPAIPINGMASTLSANDSTNGLYIYNGATWRAPWNLPWGYTPISALPGAITSFQTTLTFTGSTFTWTAVNRRNYLVSFSGETENGSSTGYVNTVGVYPGSSSTPVSSTVFIKTAAGSANAVLSGTNSFVYTATSSGIVTWRFGAQSSTGQTVNQKFTPTACTILDIGPSGAPA
jgi:hypothetical protein